MTKQESQMMKGVAILLMLFLHLFNSLPAVEVCHNFFFIDGLPLVYILSRASNPVSFFLILGGYGLYKVYEKGDRHRWSRLWKLMIHYWIILAIFLLVGHFIFPSRYPGSWLALISNITGYHTTYNGEMWFLMPYVILSAIAPIIFRIMAKFKEVYIIVGTLFIHIITSYCISRYGAVFLYNNCWAYIPLLIFHLLFSFSLGAMAARANLFEGLKRKALHSKKISALVAWGG